jgi:molybdopterin synthase catalytic subunit
MNNEIVNSIFIRGPVSSGFIAEVLRQCGLNKAIGSYSLFLGQVRSDETDGSRVASIEYTSYSEMALEKFHEIQASLFEKYQLTGFNIYHSLGEVKAGEICLLVMAASKHRAVAIAACSEAVELVKSELPVWGKLILENATAQWKEND